MAHVRVTLTTFAAVVVGGAAAVVTAQPAKGPNLPQRSSQYLEVAAFKSAGGVTKAEAAKAKVSFEAFAKYHAEYVTHPVTHTAPQDFRPEPPPPGSPQTVDQLINEINRHLIVPSPVPVLNPVPNQPSFATATA